MSVKEMGMIVVFVFALDIVQGNHFCGSTISWKPSLTKLNEVYFHWQSAWLLGRGPCGTGCNEENIGNLGSSSLGQWRCLSGCGSTQNLALHQYVVTDISVHENWEQGADSFSYTFPDQGEYVVRYEGFSWRRLDYGIGGNWRVQTVVSLGTRSDTGHPNNSPVTASKAIYRAMFGCQFQLQIPVQDPDGDAVRCRWATCKECASVCSSLPSAILDEETCTITIPMVSTENGYRDGGWYAVALTVEDFPKTTIEQGGRLKRPTDRLCSIPLQVATEL